VYVFLFFVKFWLISVLVKKMKGFWESIELEELEGVGYCDDLLIIVEGW